MNRDLWEQLLKATQRNQKVRWRKVKGHSKTAGGLHKNGSDPSRRARRGCQEGDRCRLKRRLATSLEEWEAARDLLGKLLDEQIERAFGHGGQWGQ